MISTISTQYLRSDTLQEKKQEQEPTSSTICSRSLSQQFTKDDFIFFPLEIYVMIPHLGKKGGQIFKKSKEKNLNLYNIPCDGRKVKTWPPFPNFSHIFSIEGIQMYSFNGYF